MKTRLVGLVVRWVVAVGLLGGFLALAYVLRGQIGGRHDGDDAGETPRRIQNNAIKLGAQLAESYGLKDVPAEIAPWHPHLTLHGRVVPNPQATAEIRTPFAGTLRADRESWPELGKRVSAGQVLGYLDIRVGPEVRLELLTKLNDALARREGAKKIVKIQQERVDRFESASGSIARADLDAARVQLNEARIQLASAEASVAVWQDALAQINHQGDRKDAAWSYPLKTPFPGVVTDVAAGPGTAVEAGSLIIRVVDFQRVLVRLDIPLSALAAGAPPQVELIAVAAAPAALDAGSRPVPAVPAVLVGPAPQVDAASQSAGFWYEVNLAATSGKPSVSASPSPATGAFPENRDKAASNLPEFWRPGLFVKAEVPVQGVPAQSAVAVPRSALLYHQGRALVYVRLSPGRYERREVQVLGREGNRWLLAGGVAAGEHVVSQRAQVLLSEEFRGETDND